jgi:hypothetical protein
MKSTKNFIKILTLAAAVVGAAASTWAADDGVYTFIIHGTVNFGATLGLVVTNTFGITTGDTFTGTLTYDSSQPGFFIGGQNDPSLVGYQITGPLVSLTVQGQHSLSMSLSFLWIIQMAVHRS